MFDLLTDVELANMERHAYYEASRCWIEVRDNPELKSILLPSAQSADDFWREVANALHARGKVVPSAPDTEARS